jgi:hypothetical protein
MEHLLLYLLIQVANWNLFQDRVMTIISGQTISLKPEEVKSQEGERYGSSYKIEMKLRQDLLTPNTIVF